MSVLVLIFPSLKVVKMNETFTSIHGETEYNEQIKVNNSGCVVGVGVTFLLSS
jgi:hypothetical protein